MNRLERILVGLAEGKNIRFLLRTIVQKYPENPNFINNAQETLVDNPEGIVDHTANVLTILSCGHPFTGFVVECSCYPPRGFCLECSAKIFKHCEYCGNPIAPCCASHSNVGRKYACPKHKWMWVLGK